MSRQVIPMEDGTMLVIGWDPPFQTWFAVHYDDDDPDKAPRVVIGYHPAEQAILKDERPGAIIGPYPVAEFIDLIKLIEDFMGIAGDPAPCVYCGMPTHESNRDCNYHPYDRIRNG